MATSWGDRCNGFTALVLSNKLSSLTAAVAGCSCSGQAMYFAQPRYLAWISMLVHCFGNSLVRLMVECGQCFGNYDDCTRGFRSHWPNNDDNCFRVQRACFGKRRCHGSRKSLKLCWHFFCQQSVLRKPDLAFQYCLKKFGENRRSDVFQVEKDVEPRGEIQHIETGPYPTVYFSLVVDSTIFMQLMVQLLTRWKFLVSFDQYEKPFFPNWTEWTEIAAPKMRHGFQSLQITYTRSRFSAQYSPGESLSSVKKNTSEPLLK